MDIPRLYEYFVPLNRDKMFLMHPLSASSLASCRTFGELAQLLVQTPIYDHPFEGCLIAEIGEDARIREEGRYGIAGPGPVAEAVPLWDTGLIAGALKSPSPSLIKNASEAASRSLLTPNSDFDQLVITNGFQSLVVLPLRHAGLLKGVVGLASVRNIEGAISSNFDYKEFQASMLLATRSISYGLKAGQRESTLPTIPTTDRDRELIGMISRGLTNKEISKELSLSLPTVKLGVSSLLSKFSARSRHEVVETARLQGLI